MRLQIFWRCYYLLAHLSNWWTRCYHNVGTCRPVGLMPQGIFMLSLVSVSSVLVCHSWHWCRQRLLFEYARVLSLLIKRKEMTDCWWYLWTEIKRNLYLPIKLTRSWMHDCLGRMYLCLVLYLKQHRKQVEKEEESTEEENTSATQMHCLHTHLVIC